MNMKQLTVMWIGILAITGYTLTEAAGGGGGLPGLLRYVQVVSVMGTVTAGLIAAAGYTNPKRAK